MTSFPFSFHSSTGTRSTMNFLWFTDNKSILDKFPDVLTYIVQRNLFHKMLNLIADVIHEQTA